MTEALSKAARKRRAYWVGEIRKLSGDFGGDSDRLDAELRRELESDGSEPLVDHLHTCGAIPEDYGHDSSEEKLYSKYTDTLLAFAFEHIGAQSLVLKERGDSADVEAVCDKFSLVADAKAFRLSRTAKNQKDFKVEAMAGWKRGKPHALVVCPMYQLPAMSSQIYQQAIARDVCLLTYCHLATVVRIADELGPSKAQSAVAAMLQSVAELNPGKDAASYWTHLNRALLTGGQEVKRHWTREKVASVEALGVAKGEALDMLAAQREAIMRMSRDQAVRALLDATKLDSRVKVIEAVGDNGILDLE